MTLKDKYKIQKKVKEHNRKAKRDERRNGGKTKIKKDPGVPRLHPFREEIMREIEESKQRVEQAKLERREQLRNQAKYKAKGGVSSLAELQVASLFLHDHAMLPYVLCPGKGSIQNASLRGRVCCSGW